MRGGIFQNGIKRLRVIGELIVTFLNRFQRFDNNIRDLAFQCAVQFALEMFFDFGLRLSGECLIDGQQIIHTRFVRFVAENNFFA